MMKVFTIDRNAVWTGDEEEIDPDLGRSPRAISVEPPSFNRGTHFAVWSGDEWLIRPLNELPVQPDPVYAVPQSVTMRQARIALSRAGVLKAAEDAIAAMPGQPGEEARIEWAFAAELRRDHPLVTSLGDTLGLDAAAVDDLFRSAASL